MGENRKLVAGLQQDYEDDTQKREESRFENDPALQKAYATFAKYLSEAILPKANLNIVAKKRRRPYTRPWKN